MICRLPDTLEAWRREDSDRIREAFTENLFDRVNDLLTEYRIRLLNMVVTVLSKSQNRELRGKPVRPYAKAGAAPATVSGEPKSRIASLGPQAPWEGRTEA